MNKLFKLKSAIVVCAIVVLGASCSSDDNTDLMIPDNPDGPTSEFDAELIVSQSGAGDKRNVTVNASDVTGTDVLSKVMFTTDDANMRRLYITENIAGAGEDPFVFTSQEVDEKPDGSLDLVGDDKKTFEFQIKFPKRTTVTNGTVVYKLWATTGRGDFRDIAKRNALGDDVVGTITVNYGNGTNSANGIKTFTSTKLAAPTGDGQSMTFFSLFTGEVSKIKPFDTADENKELVEIWDFGYYYTPVGSEFATLASVHAYELPGVDISAISGIDREDFNKMYFKKSTAISGTDYDSITKEQLGALSVSASDPGKLNGIAEGDIIEFLDQYGNKGLIRVAQIFLGASGNGFDADAFITLDIKVQN